MTQKQNQFISDFIRLQQNYPRKRWVVADILKYTACSRSVITLLIKKGIFQIHQQTISRLSYKDIAINKNIELTDFQEKALRGIRDSFTKRNVCLLHGVTSSGKTELYIKLINEYIDQGKQVLY